MSKGISRRGFAAALSAAAFGAAASIVGCSTAPASAEDARDGKGKAPSEALRPPGARSEADFRSRCIKCGKCIQACPYQAIQAAPFSAGLLAGLPVVDARAQACRLCEDLPCIGVCPTQALRDVDAREDVRMGIARIDEDVCIAFKGMRCEVCYRNCPLIDTAITIDYRALEGDSIHSVFAPIIDEEKCVGCGLCVERCVMDEPDLPIHIVPFAEAGDVEGA